MTITPERSYTFIDKASWARGPWDDEPDKIQWQDAATGLPCLLVRHPHGGNLCGYVGVTEGHPCFGLPYDEVDDLGPEHQDEEATWTAFEVHGGITYAAFCDEDPDAEERGICHVPLPGQPERVFWLGFDASHSRDRRPGTEALLQGIRDSLPQPQRELELAYHAYLASLPSNLAGFFKETYRDLNYMIGQCEHLAHQLAAIDPRRTNADPSGATVRRLPEAGAEQTGDPRPPGDHPPDHHERGDRPGALAE